MIFDAEPVAAVYDRRAKGMPRTTAVTGRRYRNLIALLLRLPSLALLGLIRVYQHTLSPALPILTLGRCGCRFSPTCSHYAAEAIRTHGALAGLGLALARLVKCTPLHPGGLDPVPPRRAPRCAQVNALSSPL